MTGSIAIKKNDTFLMTIAQREGHSYVFASVQQTNNESKSIKLLAATGKVNTTVKGKWTQLCLNIANTCRLMTCQSQPAKLRTEPLIKSSYSHSANKIRYKTFNITLNEYLNFITLLLLMKNKEDEKIYNRLGFYIPNKKQDNKYKIEFNYETYRGNKPTQKNYLERITQFSSGDNLKKSLNGDVRACIVDQAKKLTVLNSCRATAIDLVKYTLKDRADLGSGVSRNPLSDLPFETFICGGQLDAESFYILPFPPKFYENIPCDYKEKLNFLYRCLDQFTQYSTNSIVTKKEFDALKGLYTNLTTACQAQKNFNADTLKAIWRDWQEEKRNQPLIARCYSWRWFERRTPLQVMFNTIKNQLLEENTKLVYTSTHIQSKEELARTVYKVPSSQNDQLSTRQSEILNILQRRLEQLTETCPDHFITYKKYNILKKLYIELNNAYKADNEKDKLPLDIILDNAYKADKEKDKLHLDIIKDFKVKNKGFIDEGRGRWRFFSRQTKTRQMFNDIETQFATKKVCNV